MPPVFGVQATRFIHVIAQVNVRWTASTRAWMWEHWIVVAHADLPDEIGNALADVCITDTRGLERQYTANGRLAAQDVSMRRKCKASEVTVPFHPSRRCGSVPGGSGAAVR